MSGLLKGSCRVSLALAVAAGLTILVAVASPFLSDEWAKVVPGVTEVSANEPHGGGG
ncbi:MAG: hypothetical protein HS114_25375 [Anaerolineales bacterium]|nr:hypothetical protein [Anaerolineales bacterium]